MIKNLLKIGVKRLVILGLVILLVSSLNATAFIGNIIFMASEGFHLGELLRLFLIFVMGALAFVYTLWKIYGVVSVELFKLFYDQMTPQIKELSAKIVLAVKRNMKDKHVEKGRLVTEQLKTFPWVFQFPVKILLKHIPVLKLINSAQKALTERDEKYATQAFHKDLDEVIKEVYLEATELKWLYWLVPVLVIWHGLWSYFLFV